MKLVLILGIVALLFPVGIAVVVGLGGKLRRILTIAVVVGAVALTLCSVPWMSKVMLDPSKPCDMCPP